MNLIVNVPNITGSFLPTGLKTYYIIRRKSSKSYEHLRPNDLNLRVSSPVTSGNENNTASKLISQSATNLAGTRHESVSPSALSTGPSANQNRHSNRTKTFNKFTRYLRSSVSSNSAAQAKEQTNRPEPPQIFVSTKSLPESLTSTNPSILNCCPNSLSPSSQQHAVSSESGKTYDSATSPAECANKSLTANLRQWKLPKYLRKSESRNNNNGVKCDKDCVANENSMEAIRADNDQAYQLLPIVIQKTDTEPALCNIDQNTNAANALQSTPSCSPSTRSHALMTNTDIIDVRSYISQSRSDISPFYPERADSCKYRPNRSYYGDISPMRRPRSKTVALTSQERLSRKISCDSNNELRVPNALGRKHSQYCGPSPNTLQLPEMMINTTSISQERLSTGELASWVSNISDDPMSAEQSSAIVIPPNDKIHLDPIRKQSDLQLVKCVKENAKSQQNYLVTPPISNLTLFFLSSSMEREFRSDAHQLNKRNGPMTIAFPIYNTFFDILTGIVVFSTVSAAMFLLSATENFKDNSLQYLWSSLFGLFLLVELVAMVLFSRKLCRKRLSSDYHRQHAENDENHTENHIDHDTSVGTVKSEQKTKSNPILNSSLTVTSAQKEGFEDKIIDVMSTWYKWHISFGFLMSLPALLTLMHYLISNVNNEAHNYSCHYGFLIVICIVHFCNFTQLNFWMRSVLGLLTAFAFIGCLSINQSELSSLQTSTHFQNISSEPRLPITMTNQTEHVFSTQRMFNQTDGGKRKPHCFEQIIDVEIYLDLSLVLLLVWFLNREFEIFYRFAFYSSSIAEKDKVRVQQMKDQADLLLENIIPRHVADHLKNTAKYSENHQNIAIIFASLINFNELYDESYLGGREYLRVLNELIGDFDELLLRPEFASVEKIKTIGSTYMAASGLDNNLRDFSTNDHINALMEFAMAMQDVVAAFNKDLLEFDLILRIGFNVGDVTAGVIGTSKISLGKND